MSEESNDVESPHAKRAARIEALRGCINASCLESLAGNVPDFILAEYLYDHLTTLGDMARRRDLWFSFGVPQHFLGGPAHGTETSELAPGNRDAVREAVRLLIGERPEWLPDAEEWSLPEVSRPHDRPRGWLEEAAQLMVKWLDGYTRPDPETKP